MKTESVGADILLEAHQLVTGPRNDTYGDVVDDYTTTACSTRSATSDYLTRPTTTCHSRAPWRNDNGSPTLCLPAEPHPSNQTCLWGEVRR